MHGVPDSGPCVRRGQQGAEQPFPRRLPEPRSLKATYRDGEGGIREKQVGSLLQNFGIDLPAEELAVLTRR